jgi:group II intron reverse transcriptase/maturase
MKGTMGDTQRSQTISPQNHTSVEQATHMTRVDPNFCKQATPPLLVGEVSLSHIAIMAMKKPKMVFTSLVHRIDLAMLREAYRRIKKRGAAGVDKVTAASYVQNLDQNLYNLYQRLHRGQYVATPVKRIWIAKENGKLRPIGIPAFEDKIVQKAVEMILSTVYEPKFHKFSYGFRSGKSQHQAIKALRGNCIKNNTKWIVSADITGLFDNINHQYLKDILKLRVNDGGIIRLIGKWLKAGVMEEGKYHRSVSGTPQGGLCKA